MYKIRKHSSIHLEMEKFTNWRDKATGISPFIPVNTSKSSVLTYIPKLVVSVFKLPFFIFLSILLVLSSIIPVCFKTVSRIYLLLVCNLTTFPPQRTKFGKNDLVVVNFTSFIDVLIISILEPNSYILINDCDLKLRRVSRWQLLRKSISAPNNLGELVELDQLKGKLIWYFVEGTTSNNKSILKFHIPFTTVDGRKLRTMTTIKSTWCNTVLPISIASLIWKQLSILEKTNLSVKISNEIELSQVKNSLQLNKLRSVNLDINDKADFLKKYYS